MEPSNKTLDTTQDQQHHQQQQMIPRSPFATASISLSTFLTLSSKFQSFQQTHQSTNLKIPSQPPSLSISSSSQTLTLTLTPSQSRPSKSSISSSPLHHPLTINPNLPFHPSNSAAIRRTSIVWFRNDLRLNDNECLNTANNESTSLLPVFCFDSRDFKSSVTESLRASFLIEAVANLRDNLRSRGSELIVRVGNPQTVLLDLAKSVGADAVYAHSEISKSDTKSELAIEAAMKDEGVEFKSFWSNTLIHIDDLPFDLESMPTSFEQFRSKIASLKPRKTIAALEQMKGKPARGDVEAGEIPRLHDLVLGSGPLAAVNGPVGGESESQNKVNSVVTEFKAQVRKSGKNGVESIIGANFLTKLNPWLSTGCVSVKAVFEAVTNNGGGDDAMGAAIVNELMWRDFFRFVTKKCANGSGTRVAPAGAVA